MNSDRISQIKKASNLSDIVKDFDLNLKAGRSMCPFCKTKTSFSVKNTHFTCFKCEAKGDVIEFVRQSQGVGFVEAVKFLGNRAGISTETSITQVAGNEPKAAATMYLETERKLNIPSEWYEQETFGYANKHTATVRFYLDPERKYFWERYVDGHLFERNFNRTKGGSYEFGYQPPGQKIKKADEVYITETIFDALSLAQLGKKVSTALSCHVLPDALIKKHLNVKWMVAFDGDEVGRTSAKKAKQKITELGAQCEVIDPPTGSDWNDLHRSGKLNHELLQECWWRGQILVATSARARMAWGIVKKFHGKNPIGIHVDNIKTLKHNNAYWRCELSNQSLMDDFLSALSESEYAAVKCLLPAIKQTRISNCTTDFLYSQFDVLSQEKSYYFKIQFENGSKTEQVGLKGGAIVDQNQFNKALINNVVSNAVYDGNIGDFRFLREQWFKKRSISVKSIPYTGYHPDIKAYVFAKFAYYNGREIKKNKLDYIKINDKNVKSTFGQWQPVKAEKQVDWFADFYLAGGNNGLTGLAFWLMSLFATQVRKEHGTIPFWEFTGIASSGKTTIINHLWKLIGREGDQGRDPNKITRPTLGRALMQVSNMPVVFTEGDRDSHRAKFDLNYFKTLFEGENPYGRSVFNRGLETDEPPFLGTLVVSQNHLIEGEEQILSRFVQVVSQKNHFTPESTQAAQRLERLRHYQVVGFLHKALSLEPKIMETYLRFYPKLLWRLSSSENFISGRVAKNHAQIMAFGKCLQLVVPQFSDVIYKKWCEFMLSRAISRQRDINADHPLIQKFWDIFDTYNEKITGNDDDFIYQGHSNLNHLNSQTEIAINLNHFKQYAEEKRQQIDIDAVRKLLPDSKRYKFKKTKKVNSHIYGKVVHCWVFARTYKNNE